MQPDPIKLEQIKTRGFALIPGLLTAAQAMDMRALLQTYVDEDLKKWEGRDYPDRWMVHNLMFRGLPFARRPLSIGLLGNAADVLPRLLAMGVPCSLLLYTLPQ